MVSLRQLTTNYKKHDIYAIGETGPGGANYKYLVSDGGTPVIAFKEDASTLLSSKKFLYIEYGTPEKEGVTDLDLLLILKDRLEKFQAGEFACDENAEILRHINESIDIINSKTEQTKLGYAFTWLK